MLIKVAITDDHQLIAEGLKTMLCDASGIEVIAHYPSGDALLKGFRTQVPDVLLLDISLPDRQGDELAGIIKAQYPEVKILVLTNQDSFHHINLMMQQNVDGYVLKSIVKDDLTGSIHKVYAGEKCFDTIVYERIDEEEEKRMQDQANVTLLTRREQEILHLIAQNLTNREIAKKLYLSKRTVEHHRENIIDKLEVKGMGIFWLLKKAEALKLL